MLKPPSVCKNRRSKPSLLIIGIIIIVFITIGSTYSYQLGIVNGKNSHIKTKGYISPIINGEIEQGEWETASLYMYPQFIRFDNTTIANTNWNYLSIGKNDYNLYISLDMVSINQTLPSESLEIYILLNGLYINDTSTYMIKQNWGVESLIYNIENNSIDSTNKYNTIKDASIQIGYHPSVNNNKNHRQIEISILKKELNYYDDSGELGILIIGNYENGSYYFASLSVNNNIEYYQSSSYMEVDLGNNEKIYV